MVVVHALIEGDEVADDAPAALNQVFGKAGQFGCASALGDQRTEVTFDVHAVVLPAVVEVPGGFEPRGRIVRIDEGAGERPAGDVVFQGAVVGQAGLHRILLGRRHVRLVRGVPARRRDVKLDFGKIEFVDVPRRQEGPELVEVDLLQHVAFLELRKGIEIRSEPLLDVVARRQRASLRMGVRGAEDQAERERRDRGPQADTESWEVHVWKYPSRLTGGAGNPSQAPVGPQVRREW